MAIADHADLFSYRRASRARSSPSAVWSLQHIPIHVETIRRFTSQGRPDEHWGHFHAAHIERWDSDYSLLLTASDCRTGDLDLYGVVLADHETMDFSSSTAPPLTYQPRGQTERALRFAQKKKEINKDIKVCVSIFSLSMMATVIGECWGIRHENGLSLPISRNSISPPSCLDRLSAGAVKLSTGSPEAGKDVE
ncbi:hypothetical protein ACMD2_26848 [Ananas comosus]|uniref:Uncharacterized protein n=1 Tax=Ananas comosus TaxID=4615 RepID=A0A199USR7_ANACO|nr:hypothetical protein ACMD2_26848 [Ananas comosus]